MKRSLDLFIKDILDSIKNIEIFMKNISKEHFLKNREKQNAVIREIEIVGEAVKNIPNSFRSKYPDIPWRDISGIRDIITHGYFRIDLETVWKVIEDDLPDLKQKIKKIKKDLEKEEKDKK
ncbi:MAG: DUF86 domain-containing protein [Candidatus Woesearchaeota archaeon]